MWRNPGLMNPPRYRLPNRQRVYLMRHAEAAYVREDGSVTDDERSVNLTPQGRQQARKQAALLASIPLDRAVCSGLPRTRETAALVLAGRTSPTLEVISELQEVRPGARYQYVNSTDSDAWLAQVANPWAMAVEPGSRFLGGERFEHFDARVRTAFDALMAAKGWRHLLLVLHGAVNRSILNHVLRLPWQAQASIEQDNACLNIIDVDKDPAGAVNRYLLRAVNVTGYDLNKSGMWLTTMEQVAEQLSASWEPGSD